MPILPVLLAGSLAAGIAVALVFAFERPVPALAVAALMAGGAFLGLRRGAGRVVLACAMAGTAAAGASLGANAEGRARRPALVPGIERAGSEVVALRGVLAEDAHVGASGVRLRVWVRQLGEEPHDGRELAALTVVGVLAPARVGEWTAGRAVRVAATLRRPAFYLNPGVPDDRLALARRGLVAVGTVKSGALVDADGRAGWRAELSARLRARVRHAMRAHVAPHDATAAAIATAILIGDRAGLDPDLEARLQAAGTYHVIAISGGNIAVLTVAMLGLARLGRVPPRAGCLLVSVLLLAHAELVGGGPSVMRATAMAVGYLVLRSVDQSAWSLNALAAAVAALLVISPLAIVDPGFLLSAGATAAIILLAGRLSALVPGGGLRHVAAGIAGASLASEIVLLPVSALFFNRVTLAGLVLNLGAVPLMAVVQIAASLTVAGDAASGSSALPAVPGMVAAVAARGLVVTSHVVEWWPWLALRVPAPHWVVTALYLVAVVAVVAWMPVANAPHRRTMGRAAALVAVSVGLWILLAPHTWRWPWRADGLLKIVALDVGQGDATLIEFPDGQRWLVDAGGLPGGGRFDVGARVVAPALWWRGVGRLDRLVLTHGDPDHLGGANAVIDDFRPALTEGVPVPSHRPMAAVRARASSRGRPWSAASTGTSWRVGEVAVRVLHPEPPDWERQRVRNDDSIVLELRYRKVSVILPGDISAEVERALVSRIPLAPRRVLKLAHHGSGTSTSAEWLEGLRPQIAIVSCGRENRYGHPAPGVLARLRERGIEVRRTDLEGMVVVATDGRRIVADGDREGAKGTKARSVQEGR
jgi:competence protein ComEC